MSSKNKKTYKEDIRQSFISYALVPAIIITITGFIVAYAVFFRSIVNNNQKLNQEVAAQLKETTNNYMNLASQFSKLPNTIECINIQECKAEVSYSIYEGISAQKIRANFYLLNQNEKMIIGSTNSLPKYLKHKPVSNIGISRLVRENLNIPNISIESLNKDQKLLTIGQAIVNKDEYLGMIVFELNPYDFTEYFQKTTSSSLIVTNSHNHVYWSTDPMLVNRFGKVLDEFQEKQGFVSALDTSFYINKNSVLDNELQVYTVSQTEKYNSIFITVAFILIFIFIMFYIFLYLVSAMIADRKTLVIDQIVETMSHVRNNDFNKLMNVHTEDEFQQIAISYNQMLSNIKKLMADNQEIGRQNVISEIKQLETQFDPHFIFNTLELIKYMVKIDPENVSKVIVGMSNLLRDSIDNSVSFLRLEEDVNYTKDYLLIQKFRFGDKLNYQFNITNDAKNCIVPKRIIQPIVENALIHGLDLENICHLIISASLIQNELVIVIEDNGKGINPQRLDEINKILSKKRNKTKYNGLYNVHRRIELIYGEQYGLNIENLKSGGAKVTINMPVKKEFDIDD